LWQGVEKAKLLLLPPVAICLTGLMVTVGPLLNAGVEVLRW